MTTNWAQEIKSLQGPILVLGASGFIGANLLKMLLKHRADVVGTASNLPSWRLDDVPEANVRAVDLLVDSNLDALLESVRPRTVFNCVAYGAYSFQLDSELIYETNFNLTAKLLERLAARQIAAYVHAGSSSEYGNRASGPREDSLPEPNSDYAVSKAACTALFSYYGRVKRFPCVNLRLYSVFGPLEDSSRLIPALVRAGAEHRLPEFVCPDVSRDFVYIDDVCEAFIRAARYLGGEQYGESFNVGMGRKTTIGEVASLAKSLFEVPDPPVFTMPNRKWDVSDWYANIENTVTRLDWQPRTTFEEGLKATAAWYQGLENKERYHRVSKQFGLDTHYSVTAIVACYKDEQAIPIMYRRLKEVFEKIGVEYEIIFVNDNSPDQCEEVIRGISRSDRRVLGISHSRNFGSQAAFRSGMGLASKNACVLLDGDLQDPPELIEQFVGRWREGYDVVYGRRVGRVAPLWMQWSYKLFYRLFDYFSYLEIPHDAGDFALMDKRVVRRRAAIPRARPVPAGRAGLRRLQANRGRLHPARTHVRTDHQQPGQEHRVGQEGHPLLQQYAADDAEFPGRHAVPGHAVAHALPDLLQAVVSVDDPPGRDHDVAGHHVLRLGQPVGNRYSRGVHGQGLRRGETEAAVHSPRHHQGWGSAKGGGPGASGERSVSKPMIARNCPICGSADRSREFAAARYDADRLTRFAFASRKLPEYMHYRLLLCAACELLYASPVPESQSLVEEYQAAAYDSALEARFAARTYARLLRPLLARLPDRSGALDIGAGDGAFLQELLAQGFSEVAGVEPSAAPIAAAEEAVRPLLHHAPFRVEDFQGRQFRLITCFQTMEHVPDPLRLCREACGLLKPGGAMLCVVHNRLALSARLLGRRSPIYDIEHLQLFSRPRCGASWSGPGFATWPPRWSSTAIRSPTGCGSSRCPRRLRKRSSGLPADWASGGSASPCPRGISPSGDSRRAKRVKIP